MAEDQEKDLRGFKAWAVVSNRGEIVNEDIDSDSSSGSSIEVVQFEGDELVSCRLRRAAFKENTDAENPIQQPSCLSYISEQAAEGEQLITSVKSKKEFEVEEEACRDIQGSSENVLPALDNACEFESEARRNNHRSSDTTLGDRDFSDVQADLKNVDVVESQVTRQHLDFVIQNADSESSLPAKLEAAEVISSNQSRDTGFFEAGKSDSALRKEYSASEHGACCLSLLKDSGRMPNESDDLACEFQQSATPSSVTFEESGISSTSLEHKEQSKEASVKSDHSDTDSDFVCLDPDSIEDFVEPPRAAAMEEEIQPQRLLHRSGSSIEPSFNFMREDAPMPIENRAPSRQDSLEYEEIDDGDVDDDTESSTEEMVDDRIESDQSEAGSLPVNNDVGDLSAFADIGDLPLVVGNVPRNYIHRPNNHLSFILNAVVVVAAILTMGISLGIIMATDLEIEEWQTAYERQTLKVRKLQSQLLEKKVALEFEMARSRELQVELGDVKALWENIKNPSSPLSGQEFTNEASSQFQTVPSTDSPSSVKENSFSDSQVPIAMEGKTYSVYRGDKKCTVDEDLDYTQIRCNGDFLSDLYKESDEEIFDGDEKKDKAAAADHQLGKRNVHDEIGAATLLLDITQLQQSLTREQERALHWQQLYLSERRQKEKERDNEEWEDERDREEWERQRNELEQVECLKKLLSANISTLTQHVAKWNVSIFDDFANLSMLMSTVAELKQSVMDTVQKVWEEAEEVVTRMQSEEGDFAKHSTGQRDNSKSLPDQEALMSQLTRLLKAVKEGYISNKAMLLDASRDLLTNLKRSLGNTVNEFELQPLLDWAENVKTQIEQTIEPLRNEVQQPLFDKDIMISYITNIIDRFDSSLIKNGASVDPSSENEREEGLTDEGPTYLYEPKASGGNDLDNNMGHDLNENDDGSSHKTARSEISFRYSEDLDDDDEDDYDDDDDDDDDDDNGDKARKVMQNYRSNGYFDDDDEDINDKSPRRDKRRSWSKSLTGFLKTTSNSVRSFGRRVTKTLRDIKTIWDKKNPSLYDIAKRVTKKFVRASVKLTKICTKLPMQWFKGKTSNNELLIQSKCIQKLREAWQKKVKKDPCQALGMYSKECNMDRKSLKRDLKVVSKLFSQLLKLKTFLPEEIPKLNGEDVAMNKYLFTSFLAQWGNTKLLLHKDLKWVECQRDWWSEAQEVVEGKNNAVAINVCDIVTPDEYLSAGGSMPDKEVDRETKKYKSDEGTGRWATKTDPGSTRPTDNAVENKTHMGISDPDWYLERAQYRLLKRREREKSERILNMEDYRDDRDKNEREMVDDDAKRKWKNIDKKRDWFLKKSEYRAELRRAEHQADWIFERAEHRGRVHRDTDGHPELESWILKQGKERENKRTEEHKSDWLFERAADRKYKRHDHSHHHGFRHKHRENHRQCYGRAFSP